MSAPHDWVLALAAERDALRQQVAELEEAARLRDAALQDANAEMGRLRALLAATATDCARNLDADAASGKPGPASDG